ncbi:hypothetical protein BH24ACT13_BH24ACT13_13820 [soil metagenome]
MGSFDYARVLERLGDAVVVVDAAGRLVYVNAALEQLLGYQAAQIVGQPMATLVPGRLRPAYAAALTREAKNPEQAAGRRVRMSALTADGHEIDVEVALACLDVPLVPTEGNGSAPPYLVGSLRDAGATAVLEREVRVTQYLRATTAVSTAVTSTGDPAYAMRAMLPVLCAELDWDVAAVWQWDPDLRRLRCAAHWRRPGIDAGGRLEAHGRRMTLRSGEGLPGRAFAAQRAEASADECSGVAFPLVGADGPQAVVEFFSRADRAVDDELLGVLDSIGRQLGLHLDRMSAEASLREVAEALQSSLLPPRLPRVPATDMAALYRAGGHGVSVGGDFYDVFRSGPGTWTVVIGDVCGKGAPAAAVTALARWTIRAAAAEHSDPTQVLSRLNRALTEPDEDRPFLTACLVQLDVGDTSTIARVTCAGHPPPYVLRADGVVFPVDAPGDLLGVLDEPELTTASVELNPGDLLLMYTDGVNEARNSAGRLFGFYGVTQALGECAGATTRETVDAIFAAVLRYQGQDRRRDDMALVALRRCAPPR